MPEGLTLDAMSFSDGHKMTISGTAPSDEVASVIDFSGKLRKSTAHGQALFNPVKGDALQTHAVPGGGSVNWSFGLDLQNGEMP